MVCPLIALMKDQVDALRRAGIAATFVNSSLTPPERASALDGAPRAASYDLLYVAPERFRSPRFREALPRRSTSRCWRSTRRTASASGATTSGPTTSRLGESARALGDPPTSR